MSEKKVETILDNLLIKNKFDENNIYYSPSKNQILKNMFKTSSKTGLKNGIPDRLYFDEHNKLLIIFECKSSNINKAVNDLKIYSKKITNYDNYHIFYVAFVEDYYEIYDNMFNKLDKKLILKTFNIERKTYNKENMNKDIHKLHNYIRDYTKISNEDKSFFIACILISLKKDSFISTIENYQSNRYIYDIIQQCLMDFDIDINIFQFLRTDENNIHFHHIVDMVLNIYKKNPESDLLNNFYNEFVKYNNSDGKSLGIVLTPDHIVKLMIKLLDIQNDDIFLDLCSGTGSFVIEALKYNPRSIIAVEYQTKLYTLLKCNMVLRDINLDFNHIIKGDCFDNIYNATKSAINPPYGMNDKKELDFIIKQLESVDEGGLVCSIVPKSKFNSNNVNNKLKKEIMSIGKIKTIIICNPKLFYNGKANVECCIILIEKTNTENLKQNVKIIDYSEDGYEIVINNGLKKTSKYEELYKILELSLSNNNNYKNLSYDSDWCNICDNISTDYIDMTSYYVRKLEEKFNMEKKQILDRDNKKYYANSKTFRIGELFKVVKSPSIEFKEIDIDVNTVAALNNNNAVKCISKSDKKTFYGNKIVVITGGNGGAGLAFYQKDSFNRTSSTAVLEPKNIVLDEKIGVFISIVISAYKKKYSYSMQWNIKKIENDIISLPVNNEGEIDYEYIRTNIY